MVLRQGAAIRSAMITSPCIARDAGNATVSDVLAVAADDCATSDGLCCVDTCEDWAPCNGALTGSTESTLACVFVAETSEFAEDADPGFVPSPILFVFCSWIRSFERAWGFVRILSIAMLISDATLISGICKVLPVPLFDS